ncbi:MAG: histidine phosphatase family protein [Spirochaetia bacterium]|nr:histidine phosphatase family protein [Spirochaetia bacterium]
MNLEILLIRHGETEFNCTGRIQGSMDSPLTDRGRSESGQLGLALNNWMPWVDSWLVSPQGRARESSRLVRAGLSKIRNLPDEEIIDAACEIRCGDYEGKLTAELDREILNKLRIEPGFPYPGGESIVDVMERGRLVLQRILDQSREVADQDRANPFRAVLVSHGNFIRAFGALLTGLGPMFALKSYLNNTGLSRLLSNDSGQSFKLLTWNDVSHAHGLAEQFTNLGTG